MKIKEGFELIDVCGEAVVVAHGKENIDFSKVINMNESAALLWRAVVGREFSEADLVATLTAEYDVDDATAQADVRRLVGEWKAEGLVE